METKITEWIYKTALDIKWKILQLSVLSVPRGLRFIFYMVKYKSPGRDESSYYSFKRWKIFVWWEIH